MDKFDSLSPPTILIVDDEASITSTVSTFLGLSGFQVQTARSGREAFSLLETTKIDLIVLDVLMPEANGRDVLRRLRRENNWIPVILLTQLTGTAERIMALEEGADDYLNKPFDPHELVVRIRAVLRRTHAALRPLQAARKLKADQLSIDRTARRAWLDEREITLTPKAFAILEYMMLHATEIVSREQLLDTVWGWATGVGTRVVDTRVAELRRMLQDSLNQPRYIETIPGQGYRFVGQVQEIA